MLYRAVAYTYAPRLLTFIATASALPIVVSGLGAREYGTAAAITALASLVQVLSDAGISAAVSRAIAEASVSESKGSFNSVLRVWTLVQLAVAAIAFVIIAVVGVCLGERLVPGMTPELVWVVAGTLTVGTLSGYVRALLRTSFAFRSLSVMDVCDSLARSLAWLVVGLGFPAAKWLLVGELLASIVGLAVGTSLCGGFFKAMVREPTPSERVERRPSVRNSWREVVAQGGVFLLVRISTLGMTQVPIVMASRIGQLEVAAALAMLFKLVDLINGPLVVIGQVIGVKSVAAVRSTEPEARYRLWRQSARICAVWSIVICGFVLVSTPLASHLLPEVEGAATAFGLFGIFLVLHKLSATFGLPIDYLGSAAQRVKLMVPIFVLQTALLWIAGARFGVIGAVTVIDLCYLVLVTGYLLLARRVMGNDDGLRIPDDAKVVWLSSAGWLFFGLMMQASFGLISSLLASAVVAMLAVAVFANNPKFRREYAPRRLLNLDDVDER